MKILKPLFFSSIIIANFFAEDTTSSKDAEKKNHGVTENASDYKVVLQQIKIPLVFHRFVNMLVFDVEIFVSTKIEKTIMEDYIAHFMDTVICDTFDSARLLLEDQKKLTKSMAEKIRKRIWVQLAKKLHSINKYARIKNLKLTKISYMTRQK